MATELEQKQELLDAYRAAEIALVTGNQEAAIAGRSWKKADLRALQSERRRLESEILDLANAASGGSRLITVIPR
jgi:hypothetical protein